MKTLKLFFLSGITCFVTMSMGFPTDLAGDKNDEVKETCQSASISEVVVMAKPDESRGKVILTVVEEEPVQELYQSLLSVNNSTITLKVFNAKGTLVLNEQVTMDEFLGKSKVAALPSCSTFVMFYENTAYYFLETGLPN